VGSTTDLRALARRRLVLIGGARAVAAGTFDGPVAESHALGNATVRLPRQDENRAVATLSHDAATDATDDRRISSTVASPIGCDNATLGVLAQEVMGPAGPECRAPHVALSKRPPSWGEPAVQPLRGSSCSCCGLGRWWCERSNPSGWRCWSCHPPEHLPRGDIREARTEGDLRPHAQ
jgi:hypothetical protein